MMTTLEEFAADGAGVGGDSYGMSAFDALSRAESWGGADIEPTVDQYLSFVVSNGIMIDDFAAIRSFLPGVSDIIRGFERLLLDAESAGAESLVGAHALGLSRMMPFRKWTPITFSADSGELLSTGIMGLHITNKAAPVLLMPDAATGVEVRFELRRKGLMQATMYARPDLATNAFRRLAEIRSNGTKNRPNGGWYIYD